MGNETSRPEMPEGRSRSLSPLPRDSQPADDGAGDMRQYPSTQPASYAAAHRVPASPGAPGSLAWHRRRRRSRGLSPDSTAGKLRSPSPHDRPLNASQPAESAVRSPSPDQFPGPATQPEPLARKKSRSSKRKTKPKHTDEATRIQHADRDAVIQEIRKRYRRSAAPSPFTREDASQPLDELEPAGADEDASTPQHPQPGETRFSKRDKGKGKEVIRDVILEEATAVAGRSIFDFDDEPPPSAQPAEKRSRRDSDSKARKRRKAAQSSPEKWNGGPEAEVSDELLDQTGLGYANGDFRHGDDMGAEPQGAGETSTATHTQPTDAPTDAGEYQAAVAVSSMLPVVPSANLQPANSDSGYAEPAGQAPPGSKPTEDMPVFDDSPYYEDNGYASPGGEAMQDDDAAVSVTSEPQGLPVASDAPFSPAASHAGDEEEFDGHTEEQAPLQDNLDPASTPPQSSTKSTGSRLNAKRKTKMPFFARQQEENAEAFAELPHEDVASPPKPRRSKRAPKAQSPAQDEAAPPVVAPKTKRKKSNKQPEADVADAAAEDSDEQDATRGSQYRSGPLSNTEQARITRAVERFRQDEDLTQEELNQVIHDNPQTSERPINGQLWAAIQDACPSRPRKKLISWCRQRFHNFAARGTWTEEQDDELADLIEKYGKRWSHIAGLINRYQKDVRDRWRNYLVCRGTVKTDVWSEDEEERFRELVENSIEKIREGLSANSRKSPETLINWLDISQTMGHTRSRLQCMEKWKRMRAAEPLPHKVPTVLPPGTSWRLEKARVDLRTMTADDKYILMREVRDSGVGADTKINWKHIVHVTFGAKYERQALVVAWGRLRKAVPDWEWKTTRD